MTSRLTASVSLVLALLGSGCAPTNPRTTPNPLIGTWRLVLYQDIDSAGRVIYPYGNPPLGFIVYDAAGNVFVQVSRNPPLSRIPGTDDDLALPGASLDVLRQTIDAYIAYFGTYSVDTERHEVIHHVIADVFRDYTGTDQRRSFRIAGDSLILSDGKRVFLRAR